jgi:phage-related protein (TIGR01555 family)
MMLNLPFLTRRQPDMTPPPRIEPHLPRPERPALRIAADAVANVPRKTAESPYRLPDYAPGVLPAAAKLAMDDAWGPRAGSVYGYAGAAGMWEEGIGFEGYPFLAALTQRAEYRRPCEVIAEEMTRKWLVFKATGKQDKSDKITQLTAAMKRFRVRHTFREALELEGFMGLSQIFIDIGDRDDLPEMQAPLLLDKAKIAKGSLKGFRLIDPTWVAPNRYNSNDPRNPTFYRPQTWFVMGNQIHTTRLITLVSRPVPDILKPAYNFGGLSLSQMMKPYVDNWLRTRQSVSDLIQAFTVFVLETDMAAVLAGGSGQSLQDRAALFTAMRNNLGLMLLDKDREALTNVSAPLGTLDHLQAQAQEHMSSVTAVPLVKAFGITPSGLNASSQDEIRVFYDSMHARQERVLDDPVTYVSHVVQLNEFGEIDPEITHEFLPLWELDEAGRAAVQKTKADTAAVFIESGVIAPEDERTRIAADPESSYHGLEGEAPGPPEMPGSPDLTDPSERVDNQAEEGSESGANSGV